MYKTAFLIFLQLINQGSTYFTPDFNDFLTRTYGAEVQAQLERRDIVGEGGEKDLGSFGGKGSADEKLVNQPVVLVHGVSDYAGGRPHGTAGAYVARGRNWNEMYGAIHIPVSYLF
jgi:hypothetical protein